MLSVLLTLALSALIMGVQGIIVVMGAWLAAVTPGGWRKTGRYDGGCLCRLHYEMSQLSIIPVAGTGGLTLTD